MTTARWLCVLILALVPLAPAAAAEATVEAVQSPAWVNRDGLRLPLSAGAALSNGDEVVTGVNARARLRLADGSIVKLGENARLRIESLDLAAGAKRLLRGTLRVLDGAFRTAPGRGVVVRIEGEITVTPRGAAPLPMRDALTFYQAPRTGAPSIQPVPMDLLTEWAQQTEIQPNRGSLSTSGRWTLSIARFDNQDDALALYDSLRRDGYPARIRPKPVAGGQRYHVRLEGFASRAEAEALGARMREIYPGVAPEPMRR